MNVQQPKIPTTVVQFNSVYYTIKPFLRLTQIDPLQTILHYAVTPNKLDLACLMCQNRDLAHYVADIHKEVNPSSQHNYEILMDAIRRINVQYLQAKSNMQLPPLTETSRKEKEVVDFFKKAFVAKSAKILHITDYGDFSITGIVEMETENRGTIYAALLKKKEIT